MKKSIVLGLVALSLVACGAKEEVAADKAAENAVVAPAAEVTVEAPAAAPAEAAK